MTTTTEQVQLSAVGQIAIHARDVPRATAFYRDVLNLPLLFEIPGAAFFQCGEVRLMLGAAESPEFDHPASVVYYRVADLSAAHRQLVERGVEFLREPHRIARMPDHDLWMAFCRDSEGNTLALMEERRGGGGRGRITNYG